MCQKELLFLPLLVWFRVLLDLGSCPFSIVVRVCSFEVMGMNEWNWSNLAIWKEFLEVEHLFHKGFLREITGKNHPFFFHGKKHINMTAERGSMGSFILKPGLSTAHYSTSSKMVNKVVSVWNTWNAISFVPMYTIPKQIL